MKDAAAGKTRGLRSICDLVQADHLKFRQPRRMSRAIATRMSHVWCHHADRHEQWQEGDIASLRTGASAENVSRSITGLLKEVKNNNSQAFPEEENVFPPFFFLKEPLPGAPSHFCTKIHVFV